jgi:hypothetical protein
MAHWVASSAAAFGPATSTSSSTRDGARELTAQQLLATDSRNGGQAQQTTNGAATQPARRARRTRRTPSQISTKSLPVYMKEPGEQEVVIYRGPEDMEDMPPTTTNVIMPAVMEGPDASSVDLSEPQLYVPMPDSPHDMPLLATDESSTTSHPDNHVDNSRSNLIPTHRSRPSTSTLASSEEGLTLEEDVVTSHIDLRGDAPPYFEVVPLENLSSLDTPALSPATPDSPSPAQPGPENTDTNAPPTSSSSIRQQGSSRLSGLFNIFHGGRTASTASSRLATTSGAPGSRHRRDDSDASADTTFTHQTPNQRAASRATMHRPSFSGSGSMFSIMTCSRSRLVEHQPLTSPSTLSVNSISAPLSHTLVRTEFTYPKTGPTPEQVKLISSREAFQRFGVPYGQEALAFAASSSRVELPNIPPPDFEEVAWNGLPGPESRRDHPETVQEEDVQESNGDVGHGAVGPISSDASQAPQVEAGSSNANPEKAVETTTSSLAVNGPIAPPGLEASVGTTTGPSQSMTSTLVVPIEPVPTSSSTSLHTNIPPRSESRASSALSFATAEESIHTTPSPSPYTSVSSRLTIPKVTVSASVDAENDGNTGAATTPSTSTPTTPRTLHGSLHDREDTDTTLMNFSTPMMPAEIGRENAVSTVVVAS